jgi:glycosyltransferase involved in cell wall biosynthesis
MKPLRILAFLEATSITGPAKNLLSLARLGTDTSPRIELQLATFVRNNNARSFIEQCANHGVVVHPVEENGRLDRKAIAAMRGLAQRLQPDIVQTHAVKSHFLASLAGLGKERPWVGFHHGYTFTDWRVSLYNQLDRWSLPRAHRVVTVSLPFARQLQSFGVRPEGITVIHNAIESGWGSRRQPELKATMGIAADSPVALIVGRLSGEKDHLSLLDAVAKLRAGGQDLNLIIVGDGPERARIEQRIAVLGLKGKVHLAGQVSNTEPYYGIADVAVLSSLTEGSPNALLEAMAAGVPSVATAVGGIPEIVTDEESALLVAPSNSAALAAAMGRVLSDTGLVKRLTAAASQRIAGHHQPRARAQKLAEFYRSVLA